MPRLPLLLLGLGVLSATVHAGEIKFNRDVRPILSDNCFACHGPDAQKAKGNLRLDLRESAIKPAESGEIAIVPGKPQSSELIKRIFTDDTGELMPPPKSHKKLSAAQKETLKTWIAQGAHYEQHWGFTKPTRPDVPKLSGPLGNWVRTPIDAFIGARLQQENLSPQPQATKETLIRRATLDLTGLPPTPQEVDAFLADSSESAYEKVVDRLLASPRYGEHIAANWLDIARYADSHGFQVDSSRMMWPWRDWVINALNSNMPFDQFTVEQLAGDLLPSATRSQLVASGFNRNHRINGEGGIIDEEWRIENVIDRVETTGLTWMALTFNCCRCHDHKYDPITQREFYQFFAYFNDVAERGSIQGESNRSGGNPDPLILLPNAEQEKKQAKLKEEIKTAEALRDGAAKQLPSLQSEWEKEFSKQLEHDIVAWKRLEPTEVKSAGGATFTHQSDGSWLAGGTNPANDTYEITTKINAGQLTGILLDVLPDETLPNKSLGRGANGNFVLSGVEAEITAPTLPEPRVAEFTSAEASYQQKGWEVNLIVKDQPKPGAKEKKEKNKSGWAVDGNDPAKRQPRKAMFLCNPVEIPEGATLTIRLLHGSQFGDHNIGRFALSTTALPPSTVKLEGAKIPPTLRAALKADPAKRTPTQQNEITKFYRENTDNPLKRAEAAVAKAKKALDDFNATLPSVMVMKDLPKPREARILLRGEYDKPGDKVERALPAALPKLPDGVPNDRLGLAKWLVSPEHPLTARVWVNRAWERFFGTGIVKTTENFGSQADWPSHMDLLDWLACEFMQPTALPPVNGKPAQAWDMKAMHKLMVMSAAYRQAATVTPQSLEKDPDNRLLARGPRFRLPAEAVRDQALAISGLLVEKIGGPSVKPYMPTAVWDETSVYGNLRNYQADTGEGLYRRTMYTFWKRTAAPPTMLLFDSPSREICTVKRSRTNTPLQALALLNEVTYVEAARKLAERMISEGGATADDRIAWAFRMATSRKPAAEEISVLSKGLAARLERYKKDGEAAKKLITQGASKPDAKFDAAELAAYTMTANVLLNLDEVITRE